MSQRTTDKELDRLASQLNEVLPGNDYSIGHAYGGVRLESKGGSRDVSPRLTKGELAMWIHAFLGGAYAALSAKPV
jgi:hypothetical protein